MKTKKSVARQIKKEVERKEKEKRDAAIEKDMGKLIEERLDLIHKEGIPITEEIIDKTVDLTYKDVDTRVSKYHVEFYEFMLVLMREKGYKIDLKGNPEDAVYEWDVSTGYTKKQIDDEFEKLVAPMIPKEEDNMGYFEGLDEREKLLKEAKEKHGEVKQCVG